MALPILNINTNNIIYTIPEDGKLVYDYKPFFNLKLKEPVNDDRDITYLRLPAHKAGLNINNPIEIDIEPSYDQSVNLVLNDKINPLKLINSRFYLTDSSNYKIGDRKGNLDTNIYTEDNFKIEASLIKSVQSVIKLDFLGIYEGGKFPVGNYNFYFKLADSDGNESDFVAESGKVVCHIGNINQPKYIRGGQQNEDSNKLIKFRLNNLDLAYSYIHVYYTRTTNSDSGEHVLAYKIQDKFRINKLNTEITLSGYEEIEQISVDDINMRYAEFTSAKTLENCQNISFAGGITNDYSLFETLERLSLFITPELSNDESIGNLDHNYSEQTSSPNGFEYYNVDNVYYRLGYWEDIYRMGIVYILPDYTLSPVFNIRGLQELNTNTYTESAPFTISARLQDEIHVGENYIIEEDYNSQINAVIHNSKGVFKITASNNVYGNEIKPIGIKFRFHKDVIDGNLAQAGLKDLTRGFFFVRQKRIPTIMAQAIGIGTTKHGGLPTINVNNTYIIESFLNSEIGDKSSNKKSSLGSSRVLLQKNSSETLNEIYNNAMLCPEADLRADLYNTYFNSSEYIIKESRFQPSHRSFTKAVGNDSHYYLNSPLSLNSNPLEFTTSLLLVESGIDLIRNNRSTFSSKAGDAIIPYKCIDVKYGDYSDPTNIISINMEDYSCSATKVRGIFNNFLGADSNNIKPSTYYNIYQKGYDFDKFGNDYFKIRYNDTSSYHSISDRFTYDDVITSVGIKNSKTCYRGDCYINTYTRRMHWNFIDPELPTDTNIVDRYTWYKNYKIVNKSTKLVRVNGADEELVYNKLLPLFTYKKYEIKDSRYDVNLKEEDLRGLIDNESKNFKKYSEINGIFGTDKISRADINAVGLGYWVTFKICSNVNLAMRDVDFSNPQEEAVHGMKRSFYPLQSIDKKLKLPESKIINGALSKTTNDKYYFEIPDVPFIKTSFTTRIHYSNILQESTFVNGNRVFMLKNYQDYTLEYGALIKLIEWYGTLIAVMEHGILQIPVNERSMMTNESGQNVYINTDTVLPKNPRVISNMFGSLWANSIIKTDKFIYGIDTVAKKIWRTNGEQFEIISDLKLQKFLNDNINLRESDRLEVINRFTIKTHYNAFKSDILFTFRYGKDKWHLCWNELLEKWTTRYSWFPEFSENINNIFYTFANKIEHKNAMNYLYKHGFAGVRELDGVILPANWYDTQYPFEFEFVVTDVQGVQKIFDNLKIISNKVEPNSFIFEIVGDGYDWHDQKQDIIDLNKSDEPVPPEDSDSTRFGYSFDYKF